MQRLIKAVALRYLFNDLRVQPACAAILAVARVAYAGLGMAQPAALRAHTRNTAVAAKLDGGNGLIHRPARGNLDDKKIDRNDGPQRGDDQQQSPN